MGVFKMAKSVQYKSHWNHAKNIVAVIHVTKVIAPTIVF
jgi:hypothetical protein